MPAATVSGPTREPNPDSPPREDDRGSIEQVDDPATRRDDSGIDDPPSTPRDGGATGDPG